jgi:phage-related protein
MKGIKFDDIHSYYDLGLILSECSITPATPKTNYIDIPGADGSLDLTEALGEVKYNDRTGKLVFSVLPTDDFEEKKSEISNLLNGKKFKITLDKDPDWYYQGRCSINDWKCDKRVGQITVDLKLQPFKYAPETVVGIASTKKDISVKGFSVCPYITLEGRRNTDLIVYDENDVQIVRVLLSLGTHKYPQIVLQPGNYKVTTANSVGNCTMKFSERSL